MRNFWTRVAAFVLKHHKGVVLATIILVVLSIISASKIQVTTKMKDMLPADNPQVQMMDEVDRHFSGGTSLFITVEGDDREAMVACAESLATAIEARAELRENIRTINLKLDKDFAIQWGLLLQEAEDLADLKTRFTQVNLLPLLIAVNDSFEETYIENSDEELSTSKQENEAVATLGGMETFFTLLRNYLANPEAAPLSEQGARLAETFLLGDTYSFSPDHSMLMFTLTPAFAIDDFDQLVKFMDGIKEVIALVERDYPQLVIGYTGEIAIQADEQYALRFDMLVPSLGALVVIFLLFLFSIQPFRAMLFSLLSLVVGILLNYGVIGITLGEINMLTSTLGALLIGLGIDYGIQFVTNFGLYRKEGHALADALHLTYTKTGMGTLLAALTTALGFFVMALTGSESLSEYGVTAGIGIITCFVAMFLFLPALLCWFGKKAPAASRLPVVEYGFLANLSLFIKKHRIAVSVVGVVLTGFLFFTMFQNRIDLDLMALEPQEMPSIKGYYKIMDQYGLCPLSALAVTTSLEDARRLTEKLEAEDYIAQVESLATYLPTPEEQEERLTTIKEIQEMGPRYQELFYTPADLLRFSEEVQRLEWNIIEIGDLSVAGLGENNKIVQKRNHMIREILGAETGRPGQEVFQKLILLLETDPVLYADRLSQIDAHFTRALDALITQMTAVQRPITVADLPAQIRDQLLSTDGKRNLVMAYPRQSIMERENGLRRFTERMAKISPRITGMAMVAVSWFTEIMDGSVKAGLYIFLTIFLLLLISMKSLRRSLLALVPLTVGMIWMLGLIPLLGWRVNILNIGVIPLIMGMGIDYGVHIVERFTVENGDISAVFKYTGKALLLSALTTMIGFGSLGLMGSFAGVASIGAILFLGITTCIAAALFLTPALLSLGRKPVPGKRSVWQGKTKNI
ncbi:MAG TPA: MMPL family transporter [Firmicutes bacterium]|jgi:predicted RND superfamily exporter protein|nr:MMPL family transporter [Bacillota bacterium]